MADVDFQPGQVRYIKLGRGGMWAAEALEAGTILFGYREVDHATCLAGDWAAARNHLIAAGRTPSGASQGVRELREFYELGEDTLWATIVDGHLWWCFAQGPVIALDNAGEDRPIRCRRTKAGWSKTSLTGEPLTTSSLSSALTRTANYRMTICAIDRSDYLLRRIRGEDDPLHQQARTLKQSMRQVALKMIQQLHWREFETLVDLIFARGGWRRTSTVGEDLPDVDLILDQPVTGEVAWVQVKTGTSQAELDDYVQRFQRDGSCDRFFFICHSPSAALRLPDGKHLHLWTGDRLADLSIDVGLFDWLAQRTR